MPRHSPRPTAGRKPISKRRPPAKPAPKPIAPPVDLTAAERATWNLLAPAAHAMGTLVPETASGFRLLVETVVMRADARKRLDADGLTVTDANGGMRAHPLTTHSAPAHPTG